MYEYTVGLFFFIFDYIFHTDKWNLKMCVSIFLLEHACSIIASLYRHLAGNNRGRLVQKFVEDDHVKVGLYCYPEKIGSVFAWS